jgi:hypothetical protein
MSKKDKLVLPKHEKKSCSVSAKITPTLQKKLQQYCFAHERSESATVTIALKLFLK